MRLPSQLLSFLLVLCAASLSVAANWGYEDATVSVNKKGAGVGGGFKEKYASSSSQAYCILRLMVLRVGENKALSKPVTLGASDTLKILLTTKEDNKAKRPHQTFLLIRDPKSNLDTSFAFLVKENGKGKIELVCSPMQQAALIVDPMFRPRRTSQRSYYPQQDLSMRP